jgi:hypothetical protein
LKFVIEDIQSGKFTNIEEIKNEVSIITCDLLHPSWEHLTYAISINTYGQKNKTLNFIELYQKKK